MSKNTKNLAVIGCGSALGFHVAKRFAQEGYNVGMLSNMPEQLDEFAKELRDMGVEAYTYPADITDRVALKAALEKMEADMEQIDVVEYSPLSPMFGLVDVFDMTPENTQYYIDQQLYGSIEVANFFMPKMRERKDGAILITTSATAHFPMASHANGAVSQSALVQYIHMLHERAEMDNVYVGTIGKKEAIEALAFAKEIAAKYGADFDKPYWGANGE